MANEALIDGQILPNVYRVVSSYTGSLVFPKTFPNMLRGVMTEQEYVTYLMRVEKVMEIPKKLLLLVLLLMLLFVVGFVLCDMIPDLGTIFIIVDVVFFFLSFFIVFFWFIRVKKNNEKASFRAVEMINESLCPRGVKWTLEKQKKGRKYFIDITLTESAPPPPPPPQQQQQQQEYSTVAEDPWANIATSAMPTPSAPPSNTDILYSSPYSATRQPSYSYEAPSYSPYQPLTNY